MAERGLVADYSYRRRPNHQRIYSEELKLQYGIPLEAFDPMRCPEYCIKFDVRYLDTLCDAACHCRLTRARRPVNHDVPVNFDHVGSICDDRD